MRCAGCFFRQPIKTGATFEERERLTKILFEWPINVNVAPLLILHEGHGGTVVHETVEERSRLTQLLLRTFTFREVAANTLHPDGVSFAKDHLSADLEPNSTARFRHDFQLINGGRIAGCFLSSHSASQIK